MNTGLINGFPMQRGFLPFLACGLFATGALAALLTIEIRTIETDGVLHFSDGREAVLEGVAFPDPDAAVHWLKRFEGRTIGYRERGADRYGRLRVITELQPAMIRDKVALAYSPERLPEVAAWMKLEQGITPVPAARAGEFVGRFTRIEGTVTRVYHGREATYLNFGADWRDDFSVTIPKRVLRRFAALLDGIEGKTVRVRGVVEQENGPMVTLGQPEQLEVLHARH